jgi:glycosyltransferase involved in cell wall biosynthesis
VLVHFKIESNIVYPGIEINRTLIREDKKDYMFCLSRAIQDKNIRFIEDIINNTDSKIIFCGRGPLEQYLSNLQKKYNNFVYKPYVNDTEKYKLFSEASLFLFLPKNEPFGVTIIESIFMQTPVIAFNKGGPKEIIINKKNGILCNTEAEYLRNIKNFSQIKLSSDSKDYSKYINNNFDLRKMLEKIEFNILNSQ